MHGTHKNPAGSLISSRVARDVKTEGLPSLQFQFSILHYFQRFHIPVLFQTEEIGTCRQMFQTNDFVGIGDDLSVNHNASGVDDL